MVTSVDQRALSNVSRYLSGVFSSRMVLSTVYDGPRADDLDEAAQADLKDLEKALPIGTISRRGADRDWAEGRTRLESFIAQLEGKAPATALALTPRDRETMDEALSEVMAMGFSRTPGPRQIALIPPGTPAPVPDQPNSFSITSSTPWEALAIAAAEARLSLATGLPDLFATPMEAARAGTWRHMHFEGRPGAAAKALITLPPRSVGLMARSWVFRDRAVAEAMLERVVQRYEPFVAETVPAIDAGVLKAAGLWRAGMGPEDLDYAVLRLGFAGPRLTRRVALMEASWSIERAGGFVRHRGASPSRVLLDALAVAAGTARLEQAEPVDRPIPDGAIAASRLFAVNGDIQRRRVTWYVRDLARSIDEVQDLLAPAASRPVEWAPDPALQAPVRSDTARYA
ncbi:hypothetical protein [Parvularcula sp. LCG005]|uniref:hypothetical protein n=1 Tax=Parvularcula sp. LCG005 TaxID=3078805 RepID=UPI002943114A|nr:hypothetical protein [Parvularcula sp. LCG005]WOI52009.1 hypothetical protein RUI03_07550 [Parvularcula sp. LCG005]